MSAFLFLSFLALLVFEAARQRSRLAALDVLTTAGPAPSRVEVGYELAEGVRVPDAVAEAVEAFFASSDAEVLDLVPADLDTESLLDLLAARDPEVDRAVLGRGVGAGVAVAKRLGRGGGPAPARPPAELHDRYAAEKARLGPRARSLLVPGLSGPPVSLGERTILARRRFGLGAVGSAMWKVILLAWILGLWLASPGLGGWATLAFHLQPLLVFGGAAAAPRDRFVHAALRLPRYGLFLLALLFHVDRGERARIAALRGRRPPAPPPRVLFETARSSCPWCGAGKIAFLLESDDVVKLEPLRFRLDRCAACGAVFQNPRLSEQGLAYCYRDAYDGFSQAAAEELFAASASAFRDRVRTVRPLLPDGRVSWLDVGGGYGHFAAVARAELPNARFTVLDLGPSTRASVERGWAQEACTGTLEDHGRALAARFDVVSLFHVLEHTRTPDADLSRAADALRPGGLLVVEVPNPSCLFGRLLGRFWLPWFQPQHLCLVPSDALASHLEGLGLRIASLEYLSTAGDFTTAAITAARSVAPSADVPWLPARSIPFGWLAWPVWLFFVPIVLGAAVLDGLAARLPAGPLTRNAYRVVAVRP